MRIIKTNTIESISVTSADALYPVSNLLNNSPKKKWKAASSSVTSATLTIYTLAGASSLALVGIVADSAQVTISGPNGIIWQNVTWQNVVWDSTPPSISFDYAWYNQGADFAALWVDFPQFTTAVQIDIILQKQVTNHNTLAAGVIVVGDPYKFPNPNYGMTEGLEDYSITRVLSNGAVYYKQRDIVRTFSGGFIIPRADVYRFTKDIGRFYGSTPMMVKLVDSFGEEMVVYARLAQMPSISHSYPNECEVSFNFVEVL